MQKTPRATAKFIMVLTAATFALAVACKKNQTPASLTKSSQPAKPFDDSPWQGLLADEQAVLSNNDMQPVIRNQKINRAYAVTAARLRALMDCGATAANEFRPAFQANWFHFGLWASRQAGKMISGEDSQPMAVMREGGFGALRAALGPGVFERMGLQDDEKLARQLFTSVEQELAEGNRRLAVEVLPVASAFIERLKASCKPDPAQEKPLLAGILNQPADYTPLSMQASYQKAAQLVEAYSRGARFDGSFRDLLYHAFRSYFQAMLITDSQRYDERAEWILLGNVLIGLHEQMILQTHIQRALGAFDSASTIYKKLMTSMLMKIGIPGTRVGCRNPVEPKLRYYDLSRTISPDPQPFLKEFDLTELQDLAYVLGLKSPGRGAWDWSNYDQRMTFIAGMFINEQANMMLESSPYENFCIPP